MNPFEQIAAERRAQAAANAAAQEKVDAAATAAANDPETRPEADLEPLEAPAASGGLETGQLVAHVHDDHLDGEVTTFGLVVEVLEPFTDEKDRSEAPERARVAWFGGGLSGPIPSTDLIPV